MRRMQTGRTRRDHGIDGLVSQHRLEVAAYLEAVLSGKSFAFGRRSGDGRGKTEAIALALDGLDQPPSPAAKPDNADIQHRVGPPRHLKNERQTSRGAPARRARLAAPDGLCGSAVG